VSSAWGYHLESEVLIINELKEPDARERRALANKLKPIIAAPPDTLPINRKGLHPYDMVNRMFVLAFSNDPVPISIASQDRRWFCIWSSAPRMDPKVADRLWKWYRTGGFEAIGYWLKTRDVSKFNPAEPPMMTEFKHNLVENSMSMAESYIVDLMRRRERLFARVSLRRRSIRCAATWPQPRRQALRFHRRHSSTRLKKRGGSTWAGSRRLITRPKSKFFALPIWPARQSPISGAWSSRTAWTARTSSAW